MRCGVLMGDANDGVALDRPKIRSRRSYVWRHSAVTVAVKALSAPGGLPAGASTESPHWGDAARVLANAGGETGTPRAVRQDVVVPAEGDRSGVATERRAEVGAPWLSNLLARASGRAPHWGDDDRAGGIAVRRAGMVYARRERSAAGDAGDRDGAATVRLAGASRLAASCAVAAGSAEVRK